MLHLQSQVINLQTVSIFFQPELSIFCLKSDFLFCLSDLDNYLKYSFVREENLDSDILKGFSLAWFHHNNLALQAPNIF